MYKVYKISTNKWKAQSTEAEFWFVMTTLMFINLQLSERQNSLKQTEV